MGNKISVTDAAASPKIAADHFRITDGLQLALSQLGDGFFPLRGKTPIGNVLRDNKDLNGEVLPLAGGLKVAVRDFMALVDGTVLSDKNKAQFSPTRLTALTIPSAGTWYVTLRAQRVIGTDLANRPDWDRGVLAIENTSPAANSGKILAAKIIVPNGSTLITSNMINNSVRDYLIDMDDLNASLKTLAAVVAASGGGGGGGGGGAGFADLNTLAALILVTNFKAELNSGHSEVNGSGLKTVVFNPHGGGLPAEPYLDTAKCSGWESFYDPLLSMQYMTPALVGASIQAESNAVTKSTGWTTVADAGASGGSVVQATTTGKTLTVPFNGRKASIVYPRYLQGGGLLVSVDGGSPVVVSQSGAAADQVEMVVAENLLPGAHTMLITSQASGTAITTTPNYQGTALPVNSGWVMTYSGSGSRTEAVSGGVYTLSSFEDVQYQLPTVVANVTSINITMRAAVKTVNGNSSLVYCGLLGGPFIYIQTFSGQPDPNTLAAYGVFGSSLQSQDLSLAVSYSEYLHLSGGTEGFDIAQMHTYEMIFDGVDQILKVDGAIIYQQPTGFPVATGGAPWMDFVCAPDNSFAKIDYFNMTVTQGATTNRVDAINVYNKTAPAIFVTTPISADPAANRAFVSDIRRLTNDGAIVYDILDEAGTVVLAANVPLKYFAALTPGNQDVVRLRATLTGDSFLYAFGTIVAA